MLTADVAYQNLTPTTQAAVNTLITSLASEYPASNDAISAACWPDDLKAMGVHSYDAWHYVDLAVVRQPFWADAPPPGNSSVNPWAIAEAVNTLTSPVSTDLDKAIQLRFLLHFCGDIVSQRPQA
jgi:hypothetical protein